MKAKIYPDKSKNNALNMGQNRETVERLRAVLVHGKESQELVDARLYMGRSSRASTVYCSVWIHGAGLYLSGRGDAGGYGYHKTSAALASAFTAAGFEFFGSAYGEPGRWNHADGREYTAQELAAIKRAANKRRAHFGGSGDSAMRDAVMAAGLELKRLGKLPGRVFVL